MRDKTNSKLLNIYLSPQTIQIVPEECKKIPTDVEISPPENSYIKVANPKCNAGLNIEESTVHHGNKEPLTIDVTNTTSDIKYIPPRTHMGDIMRHKYLTVKLNIGR